jgi:hypothetical protein
MPMGVALYDTTQTTGEVRLVLQNMLRPRRTGIQDEASCPSPPAGRDNMSQSACRASASTNRSTSSGVL